MPPSLKIISWNIAGGRPSKSDNLFDYETENLDYFVQAIAPLKPDILCLQETHTNPQRSLAQQLAKLLHMPYVFNSPASPSHIDPHYQLGTAILSQHPFETTACIPLPNPLFDLFWPDGRKAGTHARNLQIVQIQGIYIANLHLLPIHYFGYTYTEGLGLDFARQIEKIMLNLQLPLLLVGDFNQNEPQKAFPDLLAKLTEALPPNQETCPDFNGKKLIHDHIYFSSDFRLLSSHILQTHSDHYLCFAHFERK